MQNSNVASGQEIIRLDRRRALQAVAGAGALGVVGTLVGGSAAKAQIPIPPGYPAKPETISPIGQLDARYPVTYEVAVPEAFRVITQWFAGVARRDPRAMAQSMHFPFAIYEDIDPVVVDSAGQFLAAPPASLNFTGRGATQVQPGSYDILDTMQVHTWSPVAVGLSLQFDRFTHDGHKLAHCHGIYAITNNDGKWGLELASTIYTPVDEIGVEYKDAEEWALRRGEDWMLGYNLRDQSVLNSTRRPRKSASIAVYGPRDRAGNARAGNPMAGYEWKGVKSRLRVHQSTAEEIARADANFDQFAQWAGGGVGQWQYTLNHPQARVLYASATKAHDVGGYLRYTADHTLISETRGLGVLTYKDNEWAGSGFIGNMILHHDRTNSLPPKTRK
jgi:hypothetical protein